MMLSEKRAEAVKEFMVTRGIDPKRLSTKGFGITKPAASNDTKEGRTKNRRVEFTPVK
jgi:outer membrane protein OmpA-like peptidoglycan-associated protein